MKNWFSEMKDFLLLWFGQTASQLGSRMTSFALVLFSYTTTGSAMSLALLSMSAYLPEILFTFLGGSVADRWNRKTLMLASDLVAALGTLSILLLHQADALQTWHLYLINLIVGMMNAFQAPAANAALSQIIPPRHYARASGMQSLSNSLCTLACPALAAAVSGIGGLQAVLYIDLITFAIGAGMLLFFVRIPALPAAKEKEARGGTLEGFRFLRSERPALLRLILFFAFINLLASISGNGLMPAMVLARTAGDELALGTVSSCMGLGTLIGSLIATALPQPRRPLRLIFLCCACSFAMADLIWGMGRSVWIWCAGAILGYLPLPVLNANLNALMRSQVPMERQGRVFAAQSSLQYCTIPAGFLLGGWLCDSVMEPLMASGSALAQFFEPLVGSGTGSGVALVFLFTGLIGVVSNLLEMRVRIYAQLECHS